ncbi:hypothetical protein RhiirC2_716292 [Rhizophagus irregularis]|uniref:Uncharacterized protein n=1 Tax=Rhizophagus irregularis TaxID=588596 RepID=A0A2N1MRZ4_9GLOM|nr:hypothetical protein RhiirC2_716292 [Rhizophagus irregularis]
MDNISVKINDDADKIEIDVDKNDVDKIDVDENDVDKIFNFDDERHNGKPITRIEISPNEKYLITYSEEDHSIVGWNVEDIDKFQLKLDKTVKINEDEIRSLCVSDDKKLAYAYTGRKYISIIDMNNNEKIALNLDTKIANQIDYYCNFNLKGEFILYSSFNPSLDDRKTIWIYSTHTKNNKWECKRFYVTPVDYELISISKYDKVYLVSNDYIYEWDINTEKTVKIFSNNEDKNKLKTKNIGIFSNEKFIFLKINDKIIVYSIKFKIPITSLDTNNDIRLYNFMDYNGLFLLPSLFYYTPDKEIKYCWNNKYKNRFNQTLFDEPTDEQKNLVFGSVWKSKFKEKMSEMNFSSKNSDELNKENNEIIECDDDDKIKKTYENINIHSFMDTVSTLLQKVISDDYCKKIINNTGKKKKSTELIGNLIKWVICIDDSKIDLAVSTKHSTEWNLIIERTDNYYFPYKYSLSADVLCNDHDEIASSLFNNNDIVIITTFGILIYTFSEKNKSISLNYFYFMKFDYYGSKHMNKILQHYKKIFSKSTLPLPNYDSFRLDGWISVAKNNKSSFLKYGIELLTFAIKEHKLELIDEIYKKYVKTTPTITFMIPYINFVNYSKDYNLVLELIKPQPSLFTETINRNIYKTWNGEALINFKWNTYGKYYYAMIWILFMALLGCFTAAATIPQKYINEEVRQQLFIASIILGFIHLIFEIRQFFYNIIKWFYNFWNIFGKYKCLI